MDKPKLSVVIHTLNEEKNIRNCLETVSWADEIILVDMHSDDRTVAIAREYTERIFPFERLGYADPARQFSLEKAQHEWVLSIDADELVPLAMKRRIEAIMANDLSDVVYFPHNNYFFGRKMRGAGWGALQDRHPRLFKKSFVAFGEQVHAFFQLTGHPRVLKLDDPREGFIHFNYLDVEQFIDKLNRYTSIEAENIFQGKKPPMGYFRMMLQSLKTVIGRLFVKGGYRDGWQGVSLALLMGAYQVATFAKLRLMRRYRSAQPRDAITADYTEIARIVIAEHHGSQAKRNPDDSN